MTFRSYPRKSDMAGDVPGHAQPIIAVDTNWVRTNGNRAQRRRIEKALRRSTSTKRKTP